MSIPSSAPAHQTLFGSPGLVHSLGSSPRRTRDGFTRPSSSSRLSLATRQCVIVESDEEHVPDEHGSTGKMGYLAGLGRGGVRLSEPTNCLPAPLPLSTPLLSPPFRKHPPSPLALHCLSSSFPPHSADEMSFNAPSSTSSSSASSQASSDKHLADPPSSAGILPSMTSLARQRLGLCPLSSNDDLLSTRSRAMGQLSDALERRLAKEKPLSPIIPAPRAPLVLAGGLINPKRDERKALGLRAAVGSYKMRAASQAGDHSGSDTGGPYLPPSPDASAATTHRPQNPPSGASQQSATLTSIDPPSHILLTQPMVSHSQYLAARRESIMQRVGGHRRVVSETLLSNRKPVSLSAPPRSLAPSAAPLPSLDQIRSWAAQRKATMADYVYPRQSPSRLIPKSPSLPSVLSGLDSLPSPRPKSKQIYSHARDPSIPQICLSPDSDDEGEPAPGPAEPPAVTSRPSSPQPDALAEAILSSPAPLAPRAEQRQFLLRNLAQAQQRRSGRSNAGASMVVAPV